MNTNNQWNMSPEVEELFREQFNIGAVEKVIKDTKIQVLILWVMTLVIIFAPIISSVKPSTALSFFFGLCVILLLMAIVLFEKQNIRARNVIHLNVAKLRATFSLTNSQELNQASIVKELVGLSVKKMIAEAWEWYYKKNGCMEHEAAKNDLAHAESKLSEAVWLADKLVMNLPNRGYLFFHAGRDLCHWADVKSKRDLSRE